MSPGSLPSSGTDNDPDLSENHDDYQLRMSKNENGRCQADLERLRH
jgi:hypothetical protein